MRTSLSQYHGTVGTSTVAPSFTRAQRPFFDSVVATGKPSFFGKPDGSSNQPWSVTTVTVDQPASSRSRILRAMRVHLVVDLVREADTQVMAVVIDLAGLGPRSAARIAAVRGLHHLHARLIQQRADHLARRRTT